ncbi:MAG: hypothetical protein WAO28_00635 [Candidatus Microsaccharimonas sp.]
MKRAFYGVFNVFILTILIVQSLGIHAGATQTMGMEETSIDGTSYYMSPPNCFTACMTATLRKEEVLKNTDKDEDDKLQSPFYVQFQAFSLLALKEIHDHETRSTIEREPPPEGIPAHISLGVFRT